MMEIDDLLQLIESEQDTQKLKKLKGVMRYVIEINRELAKYHDCELTRNVVDKIDAYTRAKTHVRIEVELPSEVVSVTMLE